MADPATTAARRVTAGRLIRLFTEAEQTIAYEAALSGQRNRRQIARQVAYQTRQLRAASAAWVTSEVPALWIGGAGPDATWTTLHIEALQAFVDQFWDDIITVTSHLDANARRWVWEQARHQAALTFIEGRTAQQAGRELARNIDLARGLVGDLTLVDYRDGTQRRLSDYADMLIRTTVSTAQNGGTLTQARGNGWEWVEVFDGADCGWTSHKDPDRANGKIVHIDEANMHMLSHPRCRRAFGLRPDITSAEQAGQAGPSTTRPQREDAATMERTREQMFARRASRRRAREQREPRPAVTESRRPRAARTPRQPL